MKTISDYTIYCTEEQARKALELGAPIEYASDTDVCCGNYFSMTRNDEPYRALPTTDQMIGWLEEQGIMLEVFYNCTYKHYNYAKLFRGRNGWGSRLFNRYNGGFSSRKEAIIATIDSGLEYLSNNKK